MNLIVSVCMVIVCSAATAEPSISIGTNIHNGKGLYLYSENEIARFLEKIGYSGYQPKSSSDIRRNSKGTDLYFIDGTKRTILVASCNGNVKEIDIPSGLVWLDDGYKALAWVDDNDWKVHYKNGQTEELPFMADNRADPSGTYFMKIMESAEHRGISSGTSIHSIEDPKTPLAKITNFHGQRIFSKNNKVIVSGDYYTTRNEQSEMYIYERRGRTITPSEKVIIKKPHKSPAPFTVDDLSPWDNEVLFVDAFDFPYRSIWYGYNMKTQKMRKLGKLPYSGGFGFYLQCDIIMKVTEDWEKGRRLQ